jgi:hypothetical protein
MVAAPILAAAAAIVGIVVTTAGPGPAHDPSDRAGAVSGTPSSARPSSGPPSPSNARPTPGRSSAPPTATPVRATSPVQATAAPVNSGKGEVTSDETPAKHAKKGKHHGPKQ